MLAFYMSTWPWHMGNAWATHIRQSSPTPWSHLDAIVSNFLSQSWATLQSRGVCNSHNHNSVHAEWHTLMMRQPGKRRQQHCFFWCNSENMMSNSYRPSTAQDWLRKMLWGWPFMSTLPWHMGNAWATHIRLSSPTPWSHLDVIVL
jgi:hypothetical protein